MVIFCSSNAMDIRACMATIPLTLLAILTTLQPFNSMSHFKPFILYLCGCAMTNDNVSHGPNLKEILH